MTTSIRAIPTAAVPIALYGLLTGWAQAAPLLLSQTPQATIKEPPPNVVVTIDDSVSMGADGLTAIRGALAATFTEDLIPDGSIRLAWQSLTLTATPSGRQAADACGTFRLDHTGARSQVQVTGQAVPASADECWSR